MFNSGKIHFSCFVSNLNKKHCSADASNAEPSEHSFALSNASIGFFTSLTSILNLNTIFLMKSNGEEKLRKNTADSYEVFYRVFYLRSFYRFTPTATSKIFMSFADELSVEVLQSRFERAESGNSSGE